MACWDLAYTWCEYKTSTLDAISLIHSICTLKLLLEALWKTWPHTTLKSHTFGYDACKLTLELQVWKLSFFVNILLKTKHLLYDTFLGCSYVKHSFIWGEVPSSTEILTYYKLHLSIHAPWTKQVCYREDETTWYYDPYWNILKNHSIQHSLKTSSFMKNFLLLKTFFFSTSWGSWSFKRDFIS